MIEEPVQTGFGCLMIATGVPVYFVFCAWKNKPRYIQKFTHSVTVFLQKLMVVVETDKARDV